MNLIYRSSGLGFENSFLLRFFNIYSSFQNDICPGTGDIDGRSGVCWTKEECAALNGIADGGCASGYGVCCICKYEFLTKVCLVFQFLLWIYIVRHCLDHIKCPKADISRAHQIAYSSVHFRAAPDSIHYFSSAYWNFPARCMQIASSSVLTDFSALCICPELGAPWLYSAPSWDSINFFGPDRIWVL